LKQYTNRQNTGQTDTQWWVGGSVGCGRLLAVHRASVAN